jgi:hypothetical protein
MQGNFWQVSFVLNKNQWCLNIILGELFWYTKSLMKVNKMEKSKKSLAIK